MAESPYPVAEVKSSIALLTAALSDVQGESEGLIIDAMAGFFDEGLTDPSAAVDGFATVGGAAFWTSILILSAFSEVTGVKAETLLNALSLTLEN